MQIQKLIDNNNLTTPIQIVTLCGFMGAGKSTIGKTLAKILGFNFIDLDHYLEAKFNSTVSEFFSKYGEAKFREEELIALKEITAKVYPYGLILALGGGTLTTEECSEIVYKNSFCIYLNCITEVLAKRLLKNNGAKRPLLANKTPQEIIEFIAETKKRREPAYIKSSRLVLEISEGDKIHSIIEELNSIISSL